MNNENTKVVKLTDSVAPGKIQTIGELWESIAFFANNRVKDNSGYNGEYPIETRIHQMETLKCLVDAVEDFHNKFNIKG